MRIKKNLLLRIGKDWLVQINTEIFSGICNYEAQSAGLQLDYKPQTVIIFQQQLAYFNIYLLCSALFFHCLFL